MTNISIHSVARPRLFGGGFTLRAKTFQSTRSQDRDIDKTDSLEALQLFQSTRSQDRDEAIGNNAIAFVDFNPLGRKTETVLAATSSLLFNISIHSVARPRRGRRSGSIILEYFNPLGRKTETFPAVKSSAERYYFNPLGRKTETYIVVL